MASLLALVLPGVSGAWERLLVGTPDSRTHPSPSLPPVVPSGSSASRVVPGCQACCTPGGERPTTSQDRQRGVSVGHQLSSHLVPSCCPSCRPSQRAGLRSGRGAVCAPCALTRERERGRPRPARLQPLTACRSQRSCPSLPSTRHSPRSRAAGPPLVSGPHLRGRSPPLAPR